MDTNTGICARTFSKNSILEPTVFVPIRICARTEFWKFSRLRRDIYLLLSLWVPRLVKKEYLCPSVFVPVRNFNKFRALVRRDIFTYYFLYEFRFWWKTVYMPIRINYMPVHNFDLKFPEQYICPSVYMAIHPCKIFFDDWERHSIIIS